MRDHAAIAAAIVLFVGSSLLFYGVSQTAPADQQSYDTAELIRLDRMALDEAYHSQLIKLFGVWLSEGGRDPTYFTNGLRNTRRAYAQAIIQIDKREQQLGERK